MVIHTAGVQGCPLVGSAEGQRPLPAGGLAVGRYLKECVSERGTTWRMPPHQLAGITKPAVWFEGVLNAGTTKGTSVVDYGSSQEASGGKGLCCVFGPLTPAAVERWGLREWSRAGEGAVRARRRIAVL